MPFDQFAPQPAPEPAPEPAPGPADPFAPGPAPRRLPKPVRAFAPWRRAPAPLDVPDLDATWRAGWEMLDSLPAPKPAPKPARVPVDGPLPSPHLPAPPTGRARRSQAPPRPAA